MDDKTMAFILRRAFDKNWHKEAIHYWRLYLKQRRLVKTLRNQNRILRKTLFQLSRQRPDAQN